MTTPAEDGFHLPAEWQPHERCWMAWPCRAEVWGGDLEPARAAYAEVAKAIAKYEPVTMICNPDDAAEASLACGSGVNVHPLPISDSWLRDTGPSFLLGPSRRIAGVHWGFNAWGNLYPDHAEDRQIGRRLLEHLALPIYDAPMVLEGGAVLCDGEGTLLTTEQCLLSGERNPGLERREMEEILLAFTGARRVIWLGQGYQDDETRGHIDEIACFVRPGVVMMLTTEDPGDGNFEAFHDNLDRLRAARDAAGRSLEVIELQQPERQEGPRGRLTLSYTNVYLANGAVIIPGFEDTADHEAYKVFRKAFAGRDVMQIPALDIVRGGGGIHCITREQPAV